ncbi:MAG: 16S rRNA (uracil(1498)-N(3))-methyltransferase [Pseudomonadota bacterium]
MALRRIYQHTILHAGLQITLDQEASHHVLHVLKLKLNEPCVLFNGTGGEVKCHLSSIVHGQAIVSVDSFEDIDRESPCKIHLGQCISRGEKMDFTIQKAVELGVDQITPILSERCTVKLPKERWNKKLEHWNKVIISACEQCGRNRLPTLNNITSLTEWFQKTNDDCKLILHHKTNRTLKDCAQNQTRIALLVGPEGGFDQNEIALAQENKFILTHLGPRILRTETAALTAISILQFINDGMV